jgi:hypothetical protein
MEGFDRSRFSAAFLFGALETPGRDSRVFGRRPQMLKYLAPFAFAGAVFCGVALGQGGAAVPMPAAPAMAAAADTTAVQADLKAVQDKIAVATEEANKEGGGQMTAVSRAALPVLTRLAESLKAEIAAMDKGDKEAADKAAKEYADQKATSWHALGLFDMMKEIANTQAKATASPAVKEQADALVKADQELIAAMDTLKAAQDARTGLDNAEAIAKADAAIAAAKADKEAKDAARTAALEALKKAEMAK